MAEQTGVFDVMFHANTSTYEPGHTLELIVHVLMLPRACAVRARSLFPASDDDVYVYASLEHEKKNCNT